jgi:hypothetical protein
MAPISGLHPDAGARFQVPALDFEFLVFTLFTGNFADREILRPRKKNEATEDDGRRRKTTEGDASPNNQQILSSDFMGA